MGLSITCTYIPAATLLIAVTLGGAYDWAEKWRARLEAGHELLTVAAARVQAFNVVQGRLRGHLCDSRILHCLVEVVREKVILEYRDNICTENLINKIINRARLIF